MKERSAQNVLSKVKELAKKLHEDEAGMLILTRKIDQGIIISGNILVRVLGVERDRVKIGISAPGEVTVLRQELWTDGETPWEQRKPADTNSAMPDEKVIDLPKPPTAQ